MDLQKDQWLIVQASTKAGSKIHQINNLLSIYSTSFQCLEYDPTDQNIQAIFNDTETTLRIFVNTGTVRNHDFQALKDRAEILHSKLRP